MLGTDELLKDTKTQMVSLDGKGKTNRGGISEKENKAIKRM